MHTTWYHIVQVSFTKLQLQYKWGCRGDKSSSVYNNMKQAATTQNKYGHDTKVITLRHANIKELCNILIKASTIESNSAAPNLNSQNILSYFYNCNCV